MKSVHATMRDYAESASVIRLRYVKNSNDEAQGKDARVGENHLIWYVGNRNWFNSVHRYRNDESRQWPEETQVADIAVSSETMAWCAAATQPKVMAAKRHLRNECTGADE